MTEAETIASAVNEMLRQKAVDRDRIEKLEAALREIIDSGWQPIENAPKDIGAIIGSNGQWVLAMRWATNGMTWTSEYHRSAVVPTHWMPLPNPPKEKT